MLLFSSVNDQISFFKNFIEEFKPTQKLMKSTIRAHNKKPKQKKFVEKNKDLENENKPKRGRAKKVKPVVSDEQQVLIDNLVSAANGSSETVIDSIPNPDTHTDTQTDTQRPKKGGRPKKVQETDKITDVITDTNTDTQKPKTAIVTGKQIGRAHV